MNTKHTPYLSALLPHRTALHATLVTIRNRHPALTSPTESTVRSAVRHHVRPLTHSQVIELVSQAVEIAPIAPDEVLARLHPRIVTWRDFLEAVLCELILTLLVVPKQRK